MRTRAFLTTLCAAMLLAGCVAPPSNASTANDFGYDERDSIPNEVPLPEPEVNQRPVVGTKTLLVTVTHWQDGDALDFPLIRQHTVSTDPNALPAYIHAASNGKLTLTGQIIEHTSGPRPELCTFKPGDSAPMPINLADSEGIKAAQAHGLDANNYDYRISVIDCGGSASAWTPGKFIGVYGQSGGPHVYKHEFGHNLGYSHGSTYIKCPKHGDTVLAPLEMAPIECAVIGYGDSGDSVSGGGTLYPANNRWYSGWLDNSQVAVIERSGLYRLAKLGDAGPQLYLINRPETTPAQLALEYRKPTPFDNFPATDNRVNGVWVRYTTMGGTVLNTQLDGTPETATTDDPTLLPGKTLRDPGVGITVTTCSADSQGATIAVAVNHETAPKCTSPLPLPQITSPALEGPAAPNPINFSGKGIPGATTKISYQKSGENTSHELTVIADALGNWKTNFPHLSPGKYIAVIYHQVSSTFAPPRIGSFDVAP